MKTLSKGDLIGLRTVLAKDVTVDGRIIEGVDSGIAPAEYDIIADTSRVEIFEIKKEFVNHIPYYIRVPFLRFLTL